MEYGFGYVIIRCPIYPIFYLLKGTIQSMASLHSLLHLSFPEFLRAAGPASLPARAVALLFLVAEFPGPKKG